MDTNLEYDVTAGSGFSSARIYSLGLLYLEIGIRKVCGTQAKFGLIIMFTY